MPFNDAAFRKLPDWSFIGPIIGDKLKEKILEPWCPLFSSYRSHLLA